VAIAALLLGVVLWIAAPALAGLSFRGPHLGSAAAIDGYADQVRVLAVFLPFAALSDSMLAATRGYRQMRPTVLLDRIARPALQLAGVGALLLAAGWVAVPAPAYALAWAVPYLPVAILAGYALRRAALAHQGPLWEARSTEPEGLGAAFWKFTWPRAVASVAQLALQRVDVLLVAGLGGLGAAAVYAVAGRFVVPGQFVNQAITQAVQPRLAEHLAVDDRAAANSLYQTATGWLVFATWPMYLLVICYAPVYLGLFGSGYRSGAPVVAVLACATLIATGCGMVDVVLSMAGRTTWNLGNVSLALAAMVAIDLTLIPHLGALGAAIGLATAVVVNNLLPLAQVGSALRLHPFGRGTLAAAGLAAGCFGLLPLAVAVLAGTGPSALLIAVVIATTAYLAGAHRLRRTLALDAFAAALRRRRGLRPGDGGRVGRREGGIGRRLARQE
jgi:O-antigen/teichoic acid export membrane protein